jgi:hypothetical protein
LHQEEKSMNRIRKQGIVILVAVLAAAFSALAPIGAPLQVSMAGAKPATAGNCQLASARGDIQHVIYLQFDNVHFTRDNPNVPSDLEQMPNLLNFMTGNGVLLDNHHTPLISHTGNDILTALTGLYGSNHGVPVANSYRYFNPNGTTSSASSFGYWTDLIGNGKYNMLSGPGTPGTNTPAPWVPYTRAGCNVGGVGTANIELENIGSDVDNVFGPNSPQHQEAQQNPPQAVRDFEGIAVHCAQGDAACSDANTGRPDLLPSEPGGYTGYQALYGHEYVRPIISPNGPLLDLDGNPINGFPGFDGMAATVSLAYVASMQEHGIPVTYAYISDAHDNHQGGGAYGPGQAGYEAALQSYDHAFGLFFNRLAADGINQSNTLFVVTSDENDHFVGGPPSPLNCDGVHVPCTYSQIGELDTNLTGLLATETGNTTAFTVHSDSAPTIYITGNPARSALVTRNFDRAVGVLTATNPLTNQTDHLTAFLADPVEENMLHMVTKDPSRTPTLTMFALPDYFLFGGAPNCNSPCVTEGPAFAWNHGDVQPDITTTWLGLVGPGVQNEGVDNSVWTDHTDIRPTMMALLGLHDDYTHDGRAIIEPLYDWAVPKTLRAHRETLLRLGQDFKQINGAVGQLGLDSLAISTRAMESGSPSDDSLYTNLENALIGFNMQRDNIAGQMTVLLENATFNNQPINEQQAKQLISQADALLSAVHTLAGN